MVFGLGGMQGSPIGGFGLLFLSVPRLGARQFQLARDLTEQDLTKLVIILFSVVNICLACALG
jgi:hypothetical protein